MSKPLSIKELANQIKTAKEIKNESSKAVVDSAPSDLSVNESKPDKAKNIEETVAVEEQSSIKKGTKKGTKPSQSLPSSDKLLSELEKINSIDYYNLKEAVYIDSDIHDIFTRLKSATKLRMGKFISYQLETFIREHSEEISEIITKEKNKFLK